jgi:hypothetical protein
MSGSKEGGAICHELFELLSESAPFHAGLVRATGLAAENDLVNAAPIYQSLDWWGGAGSIADQAGEGLQSDQKKKVLRLIAELRDVFHEAGIDYSRADIWADVFRGWLRDGVFDQEPS